MRSSERTELMKKINQERTKVKKTRRCLRIATQKPILESWVPTWIKDIEKAKRKLVRLRANL